MKVLLAEDEKRMNRALCEILRQEGYEVTSVENGEDALYEIEGGLYDIIVLDVMMPQKNGFEVAKTARAEGIKTPILMLTARDNIRDKVRGLDLGADDYMTKPFSPDEFLARIRVLSRRKGEVILDERAYADFVFSVSSSALSCPQKNKTIHLSYKEAELLKLFLDRPAVLISKEEIITRVWGYETDVGDNNVEAYVSFLRKKLSFIGSRCEIVAAKKLGYKLEAPSC